MHSVPRQRTFSTKATLLQSPGGWNILYITSRLHPIVSRMGQCKVSEGLHGLRHETLAPMTPHQDITNIDAVPLGSRLEHSQGVASIPRLARKRRRSRPPTWTGSVPGMPLCRRLICGASTPSSERLRDPARSSPKLFRPPPALALSKGAASFQWSWAGWITSGGLRMELSGAAPQHDRHLIHGASAATHLRRRLAPST